MFFFLFKKHTVFKSLYTSVKSSHLTTLDRGSCLILCPNTLISQGNLSYSLFVSHYQATRIRDLVFLSPALDGTNLPLSVRAFLKSSQNARIYRSLLPLPPLHSFSLRFAFGASTNSLH